ncbi:MAG: hypothetical protein JXR29_08030 [Methylothermaceae bacterium]|nr:hypothetical protein [Methylothermaceae bacterium]
MKRREFIRLTAAGSVAGLVVSGRVLGESAEAEMAGGVYYTQKAPGRWQGKETGHVPYVEKLDKGVLRVTTPHPMDGYDHYIIKHIILDRNYRFLAENLFDPIKDKTPISEFTLEDQQGPIYILSVCNLHDTWLKSYSL